MRRSALVLFLWLGTQLGSPAFAQPGTVDPAAQTVSVRVDCNAAANCFEDLIALTDWISGTRHPSAASPLLVDIGPGEFQGGITCGLGPVVLIIVVPIPEKRFDYVTFRGAGPGVTRIGPHLDPTYGPLWAIGANGCNNLTFESLTADGGVYGIFWSGTGTSRWLNIEAKGQMGWYDYSCPPGPNSAQTHYIFSSRLIGYQSEEPAYVAECGDNWIYGSDIVADGADAPPGTTLIGVSVADRGKVRAFGSTIRVDGTNATGIAGGIGVLVGDPVNFGSGGGEFHMHGSIVNVNVSGTSEAFATALQMAPGATMAHTLAGAFSLTPGAGGVPTRVTGANAESPFQWPAGSDVPVAGLVSVDGEDTYVETDCATNGNCNGGGTETHLMIYNAAKCGPSNPWFDSTTGCCRNQLLPACKQ